MGNVVNLGDIRILLESGRALDQMRADAREGLERLLCADISKFDGRMLTKTRDHILRFRRTLVAMSPEAQKLLEARVDTLNLDRPLSDAEALDMALEILAPELAKVSVRFA